MYVCVCLFVCLYVCERLLLVLKPNVCMRYVCTMNIHMCMLYTVCMYVCMYMCMRACYVHIYHTLFVYKVDWYYTIIRCWAWPLCWQMEPSSRSVRYQSKACMPTRTDNNSYPYRPICCIECHPSEQLVVRAPYTHAFITHHHYYLLPPLLLSLTLIDWLQSEEVFGRLRHH